MTLGKARLEIVKEMIRQGVWPWQQPSHKIDEAAWALVEQRNNLETDKKKNNPDERRLRDLLRRTTATTTAKSL